MLKYFLKEAFRNIRSAPFLNIISVISIALCLCLVGFFGVVLYNVGLLLGKISEGGRTEIYLKQPISGDEIKEVIEKIKESKKVKSVEYFSPIDDMRRNKELLEKIGIKNIADELIPSSHGLIVEFKEGTNIRDILKWLENFEKVEVIKEPPLGLERLRAIIALRDTFQKIGYILIAMIIFSSLFFVVSTINLAVQRRMEEFEIMLLCGITPMRLRIPLFIEGFLQGLFGSIIALFIVIFLSSKINRYIGDVLLLNLRLEFFPSLLFFWIFFGGIAIGIFGTFLSSARRLNV